MPTGQKTLRGIDGLRAVAAVSVLGHHVLIFLQTPDREPIGLPAFAQAVAYDLRAGLTLFFVLSGFLLFRPFAAALLGERPLPSVRAYLRNRALRILPALWVILLAVTFLLQVAVDTGPGGGLGTLGPVDLAAGLALVSNYHPDTVFTGIGPAWSLGVELVFYLALPLLALAAVRWVRGLRGAVLAALLLVAVGLAGKAVWALADDDLGRWAPVVATSFPVHADLFGYGMLAAVAFELVRRDGRDVARTALWGAAAILLLGVFAAAGTRGVEAGTFRDAIIGVACALIVLATVLPGRSRVTAVLDSRAVVAVGLISYSVYLWHVPVIFRLGEWGVRPDSALQLIGATALIAAATGALAALTYRYVERPALRRKRPMTAAPEPEPAPSRGASPVPEPATSAA